MSTVTTKEDIKREIEKIPDEKLKELLVTIKESLMAKLRKMKIQAPPNFSRNIDLYLTGKEFR